MVTAPEKPSPDPAAGDPIEPGHPRGTLAIVAVYGALLLLGWLAIYFYMFLARGAPRP